MRHLLENIAELHRAFDHPCNESPVDPDGKRVALRVNLVVEEFFELIAAHGLMEKPGVERNVEELKTCLSHTCPTTWDMVEIADGIGDLIVVLVGMALEYGIPLDRVWEDIHRANMAKVGPDGKVERRPDGKVLKPEGWQPPNISESLLKPTRARWMSPKLDHYDYRGRPGPSIEVTKDGVLQAIFYEQGVLAGDPHAPKGTPTDLPREVYSEAKKRLGDALARHVSSFRAQVAAARVEPVEEKEPEPELEEPIDDSGAESDEEDLEALCHRCGHPRRMHAVYIDRTVSTMNEKPQRRACQHYSESDDPSIGKVYDCQCQKFEEHPIVEKREPEQTEKGPELEDSVQVVTVRKDVVDAAMELCLKVVELKREDRVRPMDGDDIMGEMDKLAHKAWRGFSSPSPKADPRERSEAERLKEHIVYEAVVITKCVDANYPSDYIDARRQGIRKMCRKLEKLQEEAGEFTIPPLISAAEHVNRELKADFEEEEYDPAKDGPSVVTIDQAGMEKKLSRKAKMHAEERDQRKLEEAEERERAIASFKETSQHILGVDCTHCGACCCPPAASGKQDGDGQSYVELVHADLVRMGPEAKVHMVHKTGQSPSSSGYHLQAYKDSDGQVRCPFFVGLVGDEMYKCGCGIYEQRPYACRVFKPGDEGCLMARRNHPRINRELRALAWGGKKKLSRELGALYNEGLGESYKAHLAQFDEEGMTSAINATVEIEEKVDAE